MATMERELLAFAMKAKEEATEKVVIFADLSRIPHVQDPTFFRVLSSRLDHASRDVGARVFELHDHQICYVLAPDDAATLIHSLARISALLVDHGKTPIEVQTFDLRRHADSFLEFCRILVSKSQPEDAVDISSLTDEDANLDKFLTIEENLHAADVSSLLRQQPIYDVTDPATPTIVAYEVFTSLDSLEEIYGLAIRKNAWLMSRVTEILDGRIMNHLMYSGQIARDAVSINLHQSSVLGSLFHDFANRTSFGWRNNLIVELPYIETMEAQDDFEAALEVLRVHHVLAAIDDVPISRLDRVAADKKILRFVKVRWAEDIKQLGEDATETVRAEIARLGVERCVLTHCDDVDAVQVGLHLGFRVLQGHGVDEDVSELHKQQIGNAIASREIENSIFDEPEKEQTSDILGKFFLKIFGRKDE